jgi:hypothetical protein
MRCQGNAVKANIRKLFNMSFQEFELSLIGRGSGPKMGYVGKTGYQCLTRNESWQLLVLAPNACVWTLVLVVCCQKCDPLVF